MQNKIYRIVSDHKIWFVAAKSEFSVLLQLLTDKHTQFDNNDLLNTLANVYQLEISPYDEYLLDVFKESFEEDPTRECVLGSSEEWK